MDRRERSADLETALRAAFEGFQAGLWTGLPAIVDSYDPTKNTVAAKCGVRMRVRSRDGNPPLPGAVLDKDTWWWVEVPLIVDCPVVFPSGGGFILTFPLTPGDPVYIAFANRCIDAHWQSGGVQNQADLRMHSLSDGFAFPGHRPLPNLPSGPISNSACQLRSDDGQMFIELTRDQVMNITTPGELVITAGKVTIKADVEFQSGEVDFNADETGAPVVITSNGKIIDDTHRHTSGTPGSPTSPVT